MRGARKRFDLVRVPTGRRRGGKRVHAGLRDGKTFALYRAARGLLGEKDFEEISVARFAKAGGCSVGAFYGRFTDKKAFLEFLVGETFRQAASRAENALAEEVGKRLTAEKITKRIAEQISGQFGDGEFAGIVRVAVKLGFSDPKSRAALDDYREAVINRAIALLAPHSRCGSEDRIREAMQAAFGILTDAAISKAGHLRLGSAHMSESLSAVIAKLVDASGKMAGKSNKANNRGIPKSEKPEMSPEVPAQTTARRKARTL